MNNSNRSEKVNLVRNAIIALSNDTVIKKVITIWNYLPANIGVQSDYVSSYAEALIDAKEEIRNLPNYKAVKGDNGVEVGCLLGLIFEGKTIAVFVLELPIIKESVEDKKCGLKLIPHHHTEVKLISEPVE